MSSQTLGIPATSPDTGIGHEDDVVEVPSPNGTGGSLVGQAMPVAVSVSAAANEALVHEVNSLRETLGQTQRTLDAVQARLSKFETSQKRVEVQLDLLIRMRQPVARPTSAAQAPPDQPGTHPDTAYGGQRKTRGVYAICVVSWAYTQDPSWPQPKKCPMKRGRSLVLNTADTSFVGIFVAFSKTWSPTS